MFIREGPMSSSYRFFEVHIPKSKASEEEPSEGKKNEGGKKKENKAIDSRRCKVDICKLISTLLLE